MLGWVQTWFWKCIIYTMDPITERQMMIIGVYNHIRNARYLGSITILRRWLDP